MNLVRVDENGNYLISKKPHLGKPREILDEIIKEHNDQGTNFYNVCGSFGDTSEIVAVERGILS
ncbi:MAG: hypothetical protein ACTSP5_16495, partial [Candidatus Heimdallarchaeota archaeon]